ncbi:MAG: 50S ribosomal protein L11 methyltransferase [Methyloligellaceae bacterium]
MHPTYKLSLTAERTRAIEINENLEALFADFAEPPAQACFESSDGDWVVEIYFLSPPDLRAMRDLLQGELQPGELEALNPTITEIAPIDWTARVQEDQPPVRCGRYLVHNSHYRGQVAASRTSVEIDAGQAFGTARHGTTRGCLMALDRVLKRTQPHRILDLGTGSGILAISAAKSCRPQSVIATDIDDVAIAVARQNARLNGVAPAIRFYCTAGTAHPAVQGHRSFDLILANILLGPLLAMAAEVTGKLAPGGTLILSGLLHHQADRVQIHYSNYDTALVTRLRNEGWTTLILTKRRLPKNA